MKSLRLLPLLIILCTFAHALRPEALRSPWDSKPIAPSAIPYKCPPAVPISPDISITAQLDDIGNATPDAVYAVPFWYRSLLMTTFLHGSTADKTAMEAAVTASDPDYMIVRPPIFTENAATGSVLTPKPPTKAHKITRADLAQFLVDQITGTQYLNQAVVVANS